MSVRRKAKPRKLRILVPMHEDLVPVVHVPHHSFCQPVILLLVGIIAASVEGVITGFPNWLHPFCPYEALEGCHASLWVI